MQVNHLFHKPFPGTAVDPVDALTLVQGEGIMQDANARVGSPRQVLFTGTPTLEQFGVTPGELQENIVLDGAVEHFTSGQVLQLGRDALVRLTFLCEPCASLEKIRPGLTRQIRGKRGFLGMVVGNGVVRVGDRIQITPYRFPVIPDKSRERFAAFVARIPVARVVHTPNLLLALGLTSSYARAIPGQIKRMGHLPVHRLVAADGCLFTKHIPEQRELLQQEGIQVDGDRVPESHFWPPRYFYATNLKSESEIS
jgi:alkylated DNA nucleotide flippase Atl1